MSNTQLNNFIISKNEKPFLINLIVKIYANYNKEFLKKLINSTNGNEYSRVILNLLNEKILKFSDLAIQNQENLLNFQKNLLSVSKSKNEINYIIQISKGLANGLNFITENYRTIYNILVKSSGFYRNEENYILSLPDINNNENIDNIEKILLTFFEVKIEKDYKIINYEQIFLVLLGLYSNKSLNELCKLNRIVNIFNANKINLYNVEKL